MANAYDGIIIGAGVMGASAALQLASAGLRNLLVLEKAPGVGFGSTGKSNAIIRQTYSHYETCLMAYEALQIFENWGEFIGLKEPRADYRTRGVLFLMPRNDRVVEDILAIHQNVGVESRVLQAQERHTLFPDLNYCSIPLDLKAEEHQCRQEMTALYEPRGGFADPVGTTQDMLEVARQLGTAVKFNARVATVLQQSGRVKGVEAFLHTVKETYHAPVVINCAGPWAMGLNQAAGSPLRERLVAIRTQKVVKRFTERLKGRIPIVNDLVDGINLRPDATGNQIFIGSFQEKDGKEVVPDPDHYNEAADAPFREEKLILTHHRVPTFRTRGDITSLSGLYTVNQDDNHPVIDEADLEGFFPVCGFSGHGFKLSPIVGMIIAQKVLGQWGRGKTAVPLDFFNRNRKPLQSFWGGFFT